jgi:hypothetical protein
MPKKSAKQSTKTLKSNDAYERFVDHWKLSYTVAKKFYDDHLLVKDASRKLFFVHPSTKDALEAALDRYVRTNRKISTSSWIALNETEIINKAKNSSNKRASVHNGKQQLTVKIQVERYTINIEELKVKEKHRYKGVKECKIGSEIVYLLPQKDKRKVDINVVGGWKPLTGKVEIYHYDPSAALRNHEMMKDYLVWKTDESGKPTYPNATK